VIFTRKREAFLVIFIFILAFSGLYLYKNVPKRYEKTQMMMDTFVTITVYSDEKTAKDAIDSAFKRMREVEKIASIYDNESEAYMLNENGYIENPSDDLVNLIKLSLYYYRTTNGSFDITVQPFIDLWKAGLWKENKTTQLKILNRKKRLIGSDKIVIEKNKIYFKEKGMKITLGGIAKGYAVDEAIKVLKKKGIKYALIDAGGDMRAIGRKPDGEDWMIALENPDNRTEYIAAFKISDIAIATSGNYERYFSQDKKVHHIINPKTGFSADTCISATVIARNATSADALATAVFVMGSEKGLKLIDSLQGVEALVIDQNRTIHYSKGVDAYIVKR